MRTLLPIMTILLTGCAVGPNYRRPLVQTPAQFRGAPDTENGSSLADLPWWEVFSDDTLKGLVDKALANNYDLRIAVQRIEQSRELSVQARAEFLPSVSYGGTASYGRNEFAGSAALNGGIRRGSFATLASAAWEVDVWGRIRRSNQSALAEYLQTKEARRALQLSIASETAQAYFGLLGLDRQLEIAKTTTGSFAETEGLFQQKLDGGAASLLDTSRAEAARAAAAALVPELERQIMIKENQVSVLLGENPGPIPHTSKLLDEKVLPDTPVGLPSELLERRPDVLAAEQHVKAASAQIGVANAAFLPRIGLTTFLGGLSAPLMDINAGKSAAFSFAASAAGPLYQGGSLKAEKRGAVAVWEEARLEYQQAALNAFQDVSNALISRQKYETIRTNQIATVAAYREAVDVAKKRYAAGRASYFEVLEAQQQLFPAENSLAVTETNRRVVIVQLYKALGGGWRQSDTQSRKPAQP
jgi:multidrug efflux system outer membrane protein